MVVSFSGIDGAGKTTQINLLQKYAEENGIKSIRKWSKARGTPGVMFLKKILRRDKSMSNEDKLVYREKVYNNKKKRFLLFFVSMIDLCWYWGIYYRFLKLFYKLVILDRYIWDTYVEVSTEFNIVDLKNHFLWKMVRFFALKPNKEILLTIPGEESLRRDLQKGEITTDSIEIKCQKISYYEQLRKEGAWDVVIDTTQGIDETFRTILHDLKYQ